MAYHAHRRGDANWELSASVIANPSNGTGIGNDELPYHTMKKISSFRSFISWFLLLIAMGTLVAGLKEGIRNVQSAEFFPIAAFAVTLGYALGFSKWTARRAWIVMALSGLLLIFAESAKLIEPLRIIVRAIPQFEFDFLRWVFQKEKAEILFPDTIIFQTQFAQIAARASAFTSRLLSGAIKHASIREFIWDVPLLFISAWAGWGISRRNQILLALIPALGIHAYVLYYTDKDVLSLQVNVFALILLLGVHQKRNSVSEKNENADRAARETHSALLILSIVIAVIAGLMPSISIKSAAQRLSQNGLASSLGLERQLPSAYTTSGLPRQHLIGMDPSLSKQITFTVKTGELPPSESAIIKEVVPRHYWRWLTYDIYNGNGWTTSPTENKSYSANTAIQPINPQYQVIRQQVEKSSADDNRLYWTGALIKANQLFNVSWRTQPNSNPLVADMLGAIMDKQSYQADSLIPILSANELRASPQGYPKEIQKYLLLPTVIPQRVVELSREITKNFYNPYDKAKAIETYLRAYPYSLQIPPPPSNRDIADYFLFDLKTGYCDYYATSMIVLARASGIPARLVIGYSNGTYNARKAEYAIREENAHSWVEVYFTGIGWVEFEPTASQSPLALPDELAQKTSSVSALAVQYNMAGVKGNFLQTNIIPILFGLIFAVIFSGAWFLCSEGFLKSHKTIRSIYQYVYRHGKRIYADASLHETPSVFAEKLKSKLKTGHPWLIAAPNEIEFLTNLYLQELYSAHPVTKDERESALKIWRKLFWRLLYARILLRVRSAIRLTGFSKTPSHAD
jgi:transglutaminase-like putative cysteine protease